MATDPLVLDPTGEAIVIRHKTVNPQYEEQNLNFLNMVTLKMATQIEHDNCGHITDTKMAIVKFPDYEGTQNLKIVKDGENNKLSFGLEWGTF